MQKVKTEIATFIGLAVMLLMIVGALVGAVYAIVGSFTDQGRHWLATALVFAVVGAYLLGLQIAKSHRAGLEHGIDLKLAARREWTASAPARSVPPPARAFDALLPPIDAAPAVLIVTRQDDTATPIDL